MLGPPGGERPQPVSPLAARSPGREAATPSAAPGAKAEKAEKTEKAAKSGNEPSTAPPVRLLRPPAGTSDTEGVANTGPRHGYLPDPEPLSSRAWWAYEVRYDRGTIDPGAPTLQCLEQPASSARRMGRFAFELWIGSELIDRIRFDFPLLAGEPPRTGPRRPLREEPSFAPGARVSTRILIPASPRATRAQILDRATGQTLAVPWPPASSAPARRGAAAQGTGGSVRGDATSAPCGNDPITTTPATPTPPAR